MSKQNKQNKKKNAKLGKNQPRPETQIRGADNSNQGIIILQIIILLLLLLSLNN